MRYLSLTLLLLATSSAFANDGNRAIQLNPANGHYYALGGSFFDARELATQFGGYVVTINDSAEEEWILDNFGGFLQIGLTAEVTPGVFLWDNGEPLVYENWDYFEPNPASDYVWLIPGGWSTGLGYNTLLEFEGAPPVEGPFAVSAIFDQADTQIQLDLSEVSVSLTWCNAADYSQIELLRDGVVIATLPGDATEYVDFPARHGTVGYRLRAGRRRSTDIPRIRTSSIYPRCHLTPYSTATPDHF